MIVNDLTFEPPKTKQFTYINQLLQQSIFVVMKTYMTCLIHEKNKYLNFLQENFDQ